MEGSKPHLKIEDNVSGIGDQQYSIPLTYAFSKPHRQRAISYFDDAEESPTPHCLKNRSWDDVKQTIRKAVREYLS